MADTVSESMTSGRVLMNEGADWRLYAWQLLWLALSGAAFWWLEQHSGLDMRLAQAFFDPVGQRFPLKDSLLLEWLNHRLLKYALIAGCGWLALRAVRRRDARLGCAVVAMLLATLAVSWLKAHSLHSCPWDLQPFGGTAEMFGLFGPVAAIPGPGHCFPGGHASSGFAVMALFFHAWPDNRRRAWGWLAGGAALGLLMGLGQMLRGAHFLSHNLWSAWVVWLVAVLLFAAFDLRYAINVQKNDDKLHGISGA